MSIKVGASDASIKGRSFSLKVQKWDNASCKSALSLQVTACTIYDVHSLDLHVNNPDRR